jgi:hypothetical protein
MNTFPSPHCLLHRGWIIEKLDNETTVLVSPDGTWYNADSLLTVAQVAELRGCTEGHVRNMLGKGIMPKQKDVRATFIRANDAIMPSRKPGRHRQKEPCKICWGVRITSEERDWLKAMLAERRAATKA